MTIREMTAEDLEFLKQMLYTAAFWRPNVEHPPMEVLLHPYLVQYYDGWPAKKGDLGFIAEENGVPVGAVWYRFFTEDQHGDGYVDDDTPELAIAVVDGHRGMGIGRALMETIHERARLAGVDRIAISVNADNLAKRLYERLGYEDIAPDDPKERMILKLG